MAHFSTDKTYHLEVVGGNAAIHGATISVDSNGELFVPSSEADTGHHHALLQPSANMTTLHAVNKNTQDGQPISSNTEGSVFTLQGPSGKRSYQFKTSPSSDLEPHGLGWQIKHSDWNVLQDDADRLLLRYKDIANCSSWIAVHEKMGDEEAQMEEEEERWVFWWVAPSAASMEDFERYVLCDIEVVADSVPEADQEEEDRAD